MINKMLPYYGVIMEKKDVTVYPDHPLPEGFSFVTYSPGMEKDWCRIQTKAGMVENYHQAKSAFEQKFLPYPELLAKNCVFILDPNKNAVAVSALWPGKHFGEEHWRVHWVAVDPDFQGLGLGKAMLTRLLTIFSEGAYEDWLYVTSQSWNYCAINIYYQFGFRPYTGQQPVNWYSEDFALCNKKGWALIDQWIEDYYQKDLDTVCLGDQLVRIITDEKPILSQLKKMLPMIKREQETWDGEIRLFRGEQQKMTFVGDALEVVLKEENLFDSRVLREVLWFFYHKLAAKDGYVLVGKSQCEIAVEEEGARMIFLRKAKYKEMDSYPKRDGLDSYWEIFSREGKLFVRDILFRTTYPLQKMEWHVLRRQETRKTPISWQSFQNRVLAMAEQVLATGLPLLSKGEFVFSFPYADEEEMQKKRNRLVKQLFDNTKPLEVTGALYGGEANEGDHI